MTCIQPLPFKFPESIFHFVTVNPGKHIEAVKASLQHKGTGGRSPLVPTQNVISDGPEGGHRSIRLDVKFFSWPHAETTLAYLK
ncbi:cytochrome p450 [Moniliophthora roreri]|nr:cytochrome p450 [Moniliophthora roreri]